MANAPDREQIRGDIEHAIDRGAGIAARDLLERLWLHHASAAVAPYVSACFERLREQLRYTTCRIAILRSFTVEPVVPLAKAAAWANRVELTVKTGSFNAYAQELLDPASWVYGFGPDVVILAIQTQDIAPAVWEDAADLSESEMRAAAERVVTDFRAWLRTFREQSTAYLLVHTLELPYQPARGILDAQSGYGQVDAIREMNEGIRQAAGEYAGVYLLDYDALVAAHGRARWHDDHKWAAVKMPLRAECMPAVANEWVRYLAPLCGRSAKVLVCDLDNTMWSGVVGEDGVEGIKVDSEYPGIAHRKLQRAILDVKKRGIVLAVASKNNRDEAIEALRCHPGMLLGPEDFSAERINWCPKAQSLQEIATELNVGLDSLAFLDDNPAEREHVRAALPEVTVLELPQDPMGYADVVARHPVLQRIALSADDGHRSRYYAEQRSRDVVRAEARTIEEFYRSLDQEVEIAGLIPATLARTAQLTQKTNQFNLTTRRYREQQLSELMEIAGWDFYTVRVRDRFGDNGLVGAMFTRTAEAVCEIDTFLLSCRVISRTVETAMLAFLVEECRLRGVASLKGYFRPTAKNGPAADFYSRHGFECCSTGEEGALWMLDVNRAEVECPQWIRVIRSGRTALREYATP